ncbi:MAG: AAA family ATPase [Oleispira sp.]|nr:AAA family ATPase [Oleispira sp.]
MTNTGKYNFIKFSKVTIRNFSLYKKNGKTIEVEEHINDGVYCLAGANGLGKTTFLNTINYGLTGIVLEPNKEVMSPQEIAVSNKRYTKRYFTGRIKEKDKNNAEIEISFVVDKLNFRIIRGFENIDELRQLEIYHINGKKKISLIQTDDLSPHELNSLYQTRLTEAVGIKNFDYFIFYQLYVLTFDENRRMIFWDDRASSHALSIAFNTDLDDTERIIKLKRKMEKLESDGRNIRWQATQMFNKIKTLQKARKDKPGDTKVKSDYDKDFKKLEKLKKEFNNVRMEYDTILKKQSFLNSDIMHLRLAHTRLFSQYSEPRSKLLENVYVQVSIKKQECCLCGAHGSQIVESIKKNIYEEKCPLCDTKINEERNDEQDDLLKQIQTNDKAIAKKKY